MNRDFKGVWIPKEIWEAEDLNLTEKVLLVEINSLDGEQGCFASNEHFAKFLKVSKHRISVLISGLAQKGYVNVKLIYKEDSKQIEKRIIHTNIGYVIRNKEVYTENHIGISENAHTPMYEKVKDNNTLFNNTINNTNNNICSPSSERDIVTQQVEEIWLLYPNKKGKATAIKKLPKLIKEHGYEKIKKCVERYALECKGKDKQYIKHGSTFFNGGYMDYLDENIAEANENEYVVGEMRML